MNLFTVAVFALLLVGTVNAEIIEVESGGSIYSAVQQAETGDIIELEAGGSFTNDSTMLLEKEIHIRSADPANRPEITMAGGEFRFDGDQGGVILEDLIINSTDPNYLVTMSPNFTAARIIKTVNVKVTNFDRSSFREDGPASGHIDSIIVRNSEYYAFNGGGYRFIHFGSIVGFDYLEFSNSTVSDFTESFIWSETPNAKEIVIDHCTITGLDAPKPAFIGVTSAGGSIDISNVILAYFEKGDGSIFDMGGFGTSTIRNSRYYDVGDVSYDWTTEEDFVEYEPSFADAANYDFTLPDDSPLLTAGTEGGPIGDPRWDPTTTAVDGENAVPGEYVLNQNYPNPFNPSTTIEYTLKKSAHTQINVYNVKGELVETLVNQTMNQGTHKVRFNANALPAGLYYYQLKTDDISEVRKMVLLK
ncbi:MAG: DUF5123 domain-containing protein [Candidatus Marinimicrobia bacterium]|nr:DUF5123 domain-containing protein [Candidatus Neomarinimicrobiota bacterium]MCF7827408.1 DUF5123 domain-containing protein [Candidatus Neomarinimicrobiota bacterium]MCF7881359.1 DUF5123 domain-containing protein [Candidatus Neomarinimicrobiota bacterium]